MSDNLLSLRVHDKQETRVEVSLSASDQILRVGEHTILVGELGSKYSQKKAH